MAWTTLHDQRVIPGAAVHRGAPDRVNGSFVYLVDTRKTPSASGLCGWA